MRLVKPQCLSFQSAAFQIGAETSLQTAACLGFRLSDPRIFVHEADIWSTLKKVGAPGHFYAQTSPRPFAEWLLLGHATHRTKDKGSSRLEWVSSVRLGVSRKVISCCQSADQGQRDNGMISVALNTDHSNSHKGSHHQNPVGSADLNPPLQLATATGWRADPWAAMSPVNPEWTLRRQFLPGQSTAVLGAFDPKLGPGAWPQGMDLRYFQQSSPNQQVRSPSWAAGEPYELIGFGPLSEGYAGCLPNVVVRQLDTDLDGAHDTQERSMDLKSVVFLPDQDLGLMWWQGSLPLAHPVEDLNVLLTLAVDRVGDVRSPDQLVAYAQRRINPNDHDPAVMSDVPLMPALAHGLVWELIMESEDHPSHDPAKKDYESIRGRLAELENQLQVARQSQVESDRRLADLKGSLQNATHSATPPDGKSWRELLQGPVRPELIEGTTLRDQDLSELSLKGWTFKRVRFERCNFRSTKWNNCHLEDVTFSHCDLHGTSLMEVNALRSKWDHCQLPHISVQGGQWRSVEWSHCQAQSVTVKDVHWQQIVMNRTAGGAWRIQGADIQRWVMSGGEATGWQILSSSLDELGLSDMNLSSLHLQKSQIAEMSAVRSCFEGALFEASKFSKSVLSLGCVLDFSTWHDCVWQQGTWSNISAAAMTAHHCSFSSFCASGCRLAGSQWRRCDLGQADFTNAQLNGAVFEHSNLREAALFGTNFGNGEVEGCNLIGAQLQWAAVMPGSRWRNNLDAGSQINPRRSA